MSQLGKIGLPSNLVSTMKKAPFMRVKASSGLRTALASWAFAGLPTVMSCTARASSMHAYHTAQAAKSKPTSCHLPYNMPSAVSFKGYILGTCGYCMRTASRHYRQIRSAKGFPVRFEVIGEWGSLTGLPGTGSACGGPQAPG